MTAGRGASAKRTWPLFGEFGDIQNEMEPAPPADSVWPEDEKGIGETMNNNATIVEQQREIKEQINQERGSLMIMGRALTSEEEARAAVLSSVETHLNAAINDLHGA